MRLIILTEELSMEVTLKELLPKLGLTNDDFQIISFEGASDLESSLVRRLRGWRDPQARFLILRDNDRGDCRHRKKRLEDLVENSGNQRPTKIRIVVQELEAWFLGDLLALEQGGFLAGRKRPASLRVNPEMHEKPVEVLKKLDRTYQKTIGAKRIAPHLSLSDNECRSFHAMVEAVKELMELNGA